ncbi:MAG: PadR family transcriptional regulator [Thermoplasmata archaeon]
MVGLYALTCMEKDGAVYGYSLASRIAERTGGVWRPGPGAIYPALQGLTERGFAKVRGAGRRREYRITPLGRRLLRKIRKERSSPGGSGPDLTLLWAEIVGATDDATYLLQRLRRSLDGIEAHLNRAPEARAGRELLRDNVLSELRAAERRLGDGRRRARPTRARRRPDP